MKVPIILALLLISAPACAGHGTIEETEDAIIVEFSGDASAEKTAPVPKAAPGSVVPATPSWAPAATPAPTPPPSGTEPPAGQPAPADGAVSAGTGNPAGASATPAVPVRTRDLGRKQRRSRPTPAGSDADSGEQQ